MEKEIFKLPLLHRPGAGGLCLSVEEAATVQDNLEINIANSIGEEEVL